MTDGSTGGLGPSIVSHVSLGTNHFDKAAAFYDAVMASLGGRRIMEHPDAIAYGRAFPEFWIQEPHDGKPASTANGVHIGFMAESKEMVQAFWDAAIAAGGTADGGPGPREEYGAPYFGCFVRDLDGHKIEATYWDMELAAKLGMM